MAEKGGKYRRGGQGPAHLQHKRGEVEPKYRNSPHNIYFSFIPSQGIHPVILLTERGKGYAY